MNVQLPVDDAALSPLDPERVLVVLDLLKEANALSRPIDEPHVISTCIEALKLLQRLRREVGDIETPLRWRWLAFLRR